MKDESLYDDSPIVHAFQSIEDKSLPRINESWIKRDAIRFDEPKPKKKVGDVPYGSMDLGVNPDVTPKVTPSESLVLTNPNANVPIIKSKPKLKPILRFNKSNTDEG